MILQDRILITGIRQFEGEVEGTNHDFTKASYVSLSNGVDNDREKGSFSREILVGSSKDFKELSKIDYPAIFDASFNLVQTRKGYELKLESYEFVESL